MNYQKKAEEILVSVYHGEAIDYKYDFVEVNLLAAALEQAYKEGVEAGRQEILAIKRRELTAEEQMRGKQVAARLAPETAGDTYREALIGMIEQFAYDDAAGNFYCGGLSALEDAFDALGWGRKHPMPKGMICDEPGCTQRVSCGVPTPKGYRSVCGEHFRLLAEADEILGGEPK